MAKVKIKKQQQEPKGLYPNADPKKYETKLNSVDEGKFQSWLAQNAKEGKISTGDYKYYKEKGYGYDYDMRAAFQKGIKPEINPKDKQWHWNDYEFCGLCLLPFFANKVNLQCN